MSYDFACWKQRIASDASPQEIYEQLCADVEVDFLDWISVTTMKSQFAQSFPGIDDFGTELNWHDDPFFQVTWPTGSRPGLTQGLIILCSWGMPENETILPALKQVAFDLGCIVYDPQSGLVESA